MIHHAQLVKLQDAKRRGERSPACAVDWDSEVSREKHARSLQGPPGLSWHLRHKFLLVMERWVSCVLGSLSLSLDLSSLGQSAVVPQPLMLSTSVHCIQDAEGPPRRGGTPKTQQAGTLLWTWGVPGGRSQDTCGMARRGRPHTPLGEPRTFQKLLSVAEGSSNQVHRQFRTWWVPVSFHTELGWQHQDCPL